MGKTLRKAKSGRLTESKLKGKAMPKTRISYSAKKENKVYNQEVTEQVDKIMSALEEAKEIHAGRKKGQTFDDFLKEF